MSRRFNKLPGLTAIIAFLALAATSLPIFHNTISASSTGQQDFDTDNAQWVAAVEDDSFVYYEENGEVLCRPATAEEAAAMALRDPDIPMRILTREGLSTQDEGNLNLVLRATAQLDSFPQAREGFLRAAETWKSRLQTPVPVTIIIDVDFGPTRFGQSFPSGVLGSTGSQSLRSANGYPGLRNALIQNASSGAESALYNALPPTTVPTNLGDTVEFVLPSAALRALRLINAVADPAGEQSQFGPPPSIGFNSNFAFDFEPSDGIDVDKTDFDAVAVHEIGHLLGFTSRVGNTELNPSATVSVSVLDLFRFRPGATMSSFTTAQRPLTSGGEHRFFAGGEEISLSTGRPDGSGGDGNQSSHWKDNTLIGFNIGIMDPRLGRGERVTISDTDLHAYDAFGYTLRTGSGGGGGGSTAPSITNLLGNLQGDTLTLTGVVTDPQSDIAQVEISLLNSANNLVSQLLPSPFNTGGASSFQFNLQVNGLNQLPTATKASLVFSDGQGNRSSTVVSDFSLADSGGPGIKKVTYNGSKLVIKGSSLIGQLQLEVNGVIVATKNNSANGKTKIGGSLSSLNIRSGPNRVRIIKNGLRSNIFVPNL